MSLDDLINPSMPPEPLMPDFEFKLKAESGLKSFIHEFNNPESISPKLCEDFLKEFQLLLNYAIQTSMANPSYTENLCELVFQAQTGFIQCGLIEAWRLKIAMPLSIAFIDKFTLFFRDVDVKKQVENRLRLAQIIANYRSDHKNARTAIATQYSSHTAEDEETQIRFELFYWLAQTEQVSDHRELVAKIKALLVQSQNLGFADGVRISYVILGRVYALAEVPYESFVYGQMAMLHSAAAGLNHFAAECLFMMYKLPFKEGLFSYLEEILMVWYKELQKHPIYLGNESLYLAHLGTYYEKIGRYCEAFIAHQQAKKYRLKHDTMSNKCASYASVGLCAGRLGRYGHALRNYNMLMALGEQMESRGQKAMAHHGLGWVYVQMAEDEKFIMSESTKNGVDSLQQKITLLHKGVRHYEETNQLLLKIGEIPWTITFREGFQKGWDKARTLLEILNNGYYSGDIE